MKKSIGFIILLGWYPLAIHTAIFYGHYDEIVLGLIETLGTYLVMSKKATSLKI